MPSGIGKDAGVASSSLPLDQILQRAVRQLWVVVVLLAMNVLLGWLGSLLSYGIGIAAALALALIHFILGRYLQKHRKSLWLLWLPTTLAVLAPVLYLLVNMLLMGGLDSALLQLLLPLILGTLLPLSILLWLIRQLNRARQRLLS